MGHAPAHLAGSTHPTRLARDRHATRQREGTADDPGGSGRGALVPLDGAGLSAAHERCAARLHACQACGAVAGRRDDRAVSRELAGQPADAGLGGFGEAAGVRGGVRGTPAKEHKSFDR